ncbi:MAG: hypothetical protein ACREX4_15195 [Gammaproteobacteria bacterium]
MKKLDQLTQTNWKQEYENLRREALQTGSRRGHGLALFLSHGMIAWLEALTALRSRPLPQSTPYESFDITSVVRPDLTTLLANMVLSCIRREAHERIE